MSRRTHVDGPHPRSKSDWPSNATDAAAPELARNWSRVIRRTAILTSRPEGSPGDPPYPDRPAPRAPRGNRVCDQRGGGRAGAVGREARPAGTGGSLLPAARDPQDPDGENRQAAVRGKSQAQELLEVLDAERGEGLVGVALK